MANYLTPGVYVEEISTLPPSIIQASTAIPVFLGYTEKTFYNGVERKNIATRISSMLEYKQYFGDPAPATATVIVEQVGEVVKRSVKLTPSTHKLYYALELFFRNGGSDCYILSLGAYPATKVPKDFTDGLVLLEKEEEPTLVVLSEAVDLGAAAYLPIASAALAHCEKFKNRFCIIDAVDVGDAAGLATFRAGLTKDLKRGAAYYPALKTSISYIIEDKNITVNRTAIKTDTEIAADKAAVDAAAAAKTAAEAAVKKAAGEKAAAKSATEIAAADAAVKKADADKAAADKAVAKATAEQAATQKISSATTLAGIQNADTALYNAVKLDLQDAQYNVVLPPSPAIAGVYATVDAERGVWKAPANVGLNAVLAPIAKITATEQDKLNVDSTGGKSINAIRSFTGRGTLVWGARTLAGNDNEWRYISVRRLFGMIEESAARATFFAVFEPNDATTWLKVKSMIESFLYNLWQDGALAGSTPKASYFVNVGLGTTMTAQDILEGKMIVEIGVAAVRPAEFIILRFSHKLQEA